MTLKEKVYVLGSAITNFIGKFHPDFIWKKHPDFGQRENPSLEDYIEQATAAALADAGISAQEIKKGYVGNFAGELFSSQGHLGAVLAGAHPELSGKPFMRVEGACASGGLAIVAAIDAIQAGHDCVIAVGAEVQTTVNAKVGADYLARASDYKAQRSLDPFTFPCLFARRAKILKETGAITDDDITKVVVKAYSNANRNPRAHMRSFKMSAAHAGCASDKNPQFLQNEEFKDHMKVSDCSQVSDGGAAIILCSESALARLGKSAEELVEIVSYGHATGAISGPEDFTKLEITELAASRAYQASGLKPSDMGVAEVHDCFAVTEILMLEALGFADYGKGAELVRSGATEIGGQYPVNTGGGLIAYGHPVGATGIKQVVEVSNQILGRCGDYQLKDAPKIGITANMGGDDRTSVVTILRRGC
jgi:acetyl-CoA acetyltransferase